MKKLLFIFFLICLSCGDSDTDIAADVPCGTKVVSGVQKSLYKGPEGGCYYENSSGNKSYVDRTDCNC
jgi:hypothetical protein